VSAERKSSAMLIVTGTLTVPSEEPSRFVGEFAAV